MAEGGARELDAARRELLRRRRAARRRAAEEAERIPRAPDGPAPLSFAQERFWFLQALEPTSAEYNVAGALRLVGPLDVGALRRAFGALVARHAALRTALRVIDGEPRQVVVAAASLPFASERPTDAAALDARLRALAAEPFDLARAPLIRALHVALGPDEHVIAAAMHHAATDGWSVRTLMRELPALYAVEVGAADAPPPPPPCAYVDWAAWQRARLAGPRLDALTAYWRGALAGIPDGADLPLDRPRPPLVDRAGAHVDLELGPARTERLRAFARAERTTLFVALLATFQATLHRLTRQDAVVVGTAWANRDRREVEGVVGAFVNTLPLCSRVDGRETVREHLAAVATTFRDAVAHAELPFERLVAELSPARDPARTPLFDVFFDLGVPRPPAPWPGLEAEELALESGQALFDLALAITDRGADLGARFDYRTALFDADTVERIARAWLHGLDAALDDPERPLARLPLLGDRERADLIAAGRGPALAGESDVPVQRRFERQVARTPEAFAVRHGATAVTYAALDALAQALAGRLRRRGVGADVVVASCLDRSLDAVVATLAIWKAGGAYLPLDPADPPARTALLLADSGARVVVTDARYAAELPLGDARPVLVDRDDDGDAGPPPPAAPHDPESTAFVIYTSGSTGRPKGVAVPHRALANHLDSGAQTFDFGPADRFCLRTPFTFDASVWELAHPLVTGAELLVAPPGTERDPHALLELVAANGVTVLQAVPSLLRAWLDDGGLACCRALRHLICAGEALTFELAERFLDAAERAGLDVRLHNLYGPAEACIDATMQTVDRRVVRGARATVPIGRPLHNVQCHVVDGALEPVPIGVVGELLVGGAGLARGYVGDPARTAERFLDDPLGTGRLYRTGDLARRLADGALEFVGRADGQVKIAGQRVEVGEIEAALAECPCVRAAAVDAREGPGGVRRLVAWIVPRGGFDRDALRADLAARLPRHMIPAAFATVDALPLTASEKVDRRALATPPLEASAAGVGEPPRTPLERQLAGLIEAVLGVDGIGRDDDFFALGGQSLLAAQLGVRVRDALGVDVGLLAFFERPTVAGLAALVDAGRGAPGSATATATAAGASAGEDAPLSFAQERLWILDRLEPGSTHYNVLGGLRLWGDLDADALAAALRDVQARQAVLRTRFELRGERPVQVVAPAADLALERVDLRGEPQPRAAAADVVAREARHRFDLASGPPIRARLLALADDEHWLVLHQHHALTDGASLGLFAHELAACYRARAAGARPTLAALRASYGALAAAQRADLDDARRAELLAAARAELEDAPDGVDLPTDRPRPARRDHRGRSLAFDLSAALSDAVRGAARERRTTPFAVLLAGFAALLHRHAGSGDIVLGTAVANRGAAGAEDVLGLFVNAVPLRVALDGAGGFGGAVDAATAAVRRGLARAELPFEQLVAALAPERDPARAPLFQISFDTLGAAAGEPDFGAVRAEELEFETTTAKLDLSVAIDERRERLAARVEYATDLFERETVERLWERYARLLAAGLAEPTRAVDALPLVGDDERRALAALGDATDAPFDPARLAHRVVLGWAAGERAAAVAVAWADGAWTYAELADRARRFAGGLVARGLEPGAVVALELERSPALLAAQLGAWLAGAAWLVSAPDDPPAWRERLAHRAHPALRVDEQLAHALLAADPLADDRAAPDAAAYVIATSGSTGEPKLAVVPHRALANHAQHAGALYDFGGRDRVLHRIASTFDAALLEWLTPLAAGAAVHLATPDEARDPARYLARAAAVGVTVLVGVPAWLGALVADRERLARLDGLRLVLCGGEPMPSELPARLAAVAPGVPLFNLYGPAETCIDAARHRCDPTDAGPPPLGRPFPGARLTVVDARGEPVPRGVVGELAIGGRGVGLGYLGDDGLTAARFVPDPAEAGARCYLTGDLVRWRADERLEYVGRADREVKVRGRRVDPAAVEAALRAAPGVREAAVTARRVGGATQLVAHVAPADLDPAHLRTFVAAHLPAASVPTAWNPVDALPRLASGKLDLRALAAAEPEVLRAPRVAPRSGEEERLARLVADCLGLDAVGVTDDFFDLGGSSLAAIDLAVRVRDWLGVELPLPDFMAAPTVASLAALLDAVRRGERRAAVGPAELRAAAVLPADVVPAAERRPHPPRRVLLTGATGFLGAHLVEALVDAGVETVVCLARAGGDGEATARVLANLERYALLGEPREHGDTPAVGLLQHVVGIAGDLAAPRLGLSVERAGELVASIDAVVHSGAAVDFLRDFRALEAANVGGTLEALRLAARAGAAFHLISTIGVAAPPDLGPADTVLEDGPLERLIGHTEGYEQTKWVAEALTRAAGERGLPVAVHRPGRVAGSACTGRWNPDDFAARAIRGSFALGLAPAVDALVDVTPVDVLARAIAALATGPAPRGATYHLTHPTPTRFDALYRRALERGARLELVDLATWRDAALAAARGNPDHPLFPLVPHLAAARDRGDDADLVPDLELPQLDRANVARALGRPAELWTPVDADVLDRWLSAVGR